MVQRTSRQEQDHLKKMMKKKGLGSQWRDMTQTRAQREEASRLRQIAYYDRHPELQRPDHLK